MLDDIEYQKDTPYTVQLQMEPAFLISTFDS